MVGVLIYLGKLGGAKTKPVNTKPTNSVCVTAVNVRTEDNREEADKTKITVSVSEGEAVDV